MGLQNWIAAILGCMSIFENGIFVRLKHKIMPVVLIIRKRRGGAGKGEDRADLDVQNWATLEGGGGGG